MIDRTYIVETIMSGGGESLCVDGENAGGRSVASQFSHSRNSKGDGAAAVSDYDNDGWVEYKSGNVPVIYRKFIVNKDNPVKLAAAENIAKATEFQINVELHSSKIM